MKFHNLKKTLLVLGGAILVLSINGCFSTLSSTTEENKIIKPPITGISENKSENTKTIYNDNFEVEVTIKNDEIITFKLKNPNADIRDLAAFCIHIYRDRIAPKLKNENSLSPVDISLLSLCLEVQIEAIYTFNTIVFDCMIQGKSPTISIEEDSNTNVKSNFLQSKNKIISTTKNNFLKKDNHLFNLLSKWGRGFSTIEPEIINNDFTKIDEGKSEFIDSFQWRRLNPLKEKRYEEKSLSPYKNYSVSDKETSMRWRAVNGSLKFYLKDIQDIYEDMDSYIADTTHSEEKIKIEDIRIEYDYKIRNAIAYNSYINNDLPFSIFCKKTYVAIQGHKGFWADSEDDMEAEIHAFVQRVSGREMLLKIRSPYTALIYRQLLVLIKGEMDSFIYSRWDNIKMTCKLYELDELSDTFSDNKLMK